MAAQWVDGRAVSPFAGYARFRGGVGRTTADRARSGGVRRPLVGALVLSSVIGLGAAGVGAVAVAEVRSADWSACVHRVAEIPAGEIPHGYVPTGRFAEFAPASCVREFGAERLAGGSFQ